MDETPRQSWSSLLPLICLILAIAAVVIVYFSVSGDPLYRLTVIVGYVILILLFFIGLMVLIAIATGKIDLSLLLSEAGGGASMSRFQLLIFTFLIAFSLFLMIVSSGTCGTSRTAAVGRPGAFGKPGLLGAQAPSGPCPPMKFPAIPSEVLMLLGISASTYAVSKGIQSSTPSMTKKGAGQTTTTVTTPRATPSTTTVQTPAAGQTTTVQTPNPAPGAAGTTTTVQTPNLDDNPR